MNASLVKYLLLFLLLGSGGSVAAADARTLNALIDSVLKSHVEKGYVDYPEVSRSVRFHKYLEAVAEFDASALETQEERLAFWINAYNALVIKQIVDGQTPIGTLAKLRFFRTTEHRVAGRSLDLQSLADDVLFELGEPRVHFAIVNSAYSAPRLRNGAYRVDEIEQQLESNTRDFLNDNRKNRFSMALERAKLSVIFEQYEDEFGGDDKAVLQFIAGYIEDEEVAEALRKANWDIEYMEFDWSINGRPM